MGQDTVALRLTDLINLGHLQNLQDSFAGATGVTTVIVDPEGREITRPSNRDGLCALFLSSSDTVGECRESTRKIAEEAGRAGFPQVSKCPHLGLSTAAVPIFVENQYMGSWIFGQMCIGKRHDGQVAEAARKVGVSEEVIREKLKKLPSFTMQEFERFFDFAGSLTKTIADMGQNNLQLNRRSKELRGLTEQVVIRDAVLTKLTQSGQEALYICDFYTGEVLMVNNAFCKQVGKDMQDILGRKCWELHGTEGGTFCGDCPRLQLLGETPQTGRQVVKEYYNKETRRWLRCTHEAVTWMGGRAAHMVTQQDVTKEYELRNKLEKMAYYDPLTGLQNRNKLREDLKLPRKRGGHSVVCLFLSSLRAFTNVYGGLAEERIVRTIVDWLRTLGIPEDSMYSLGRDQYFLMLEGFSQERALAVGERIRERFSLPWLVDLGTTSYSFVGGVSVSVQTNLRYMAMATDQEAIKLVGRMFEEVRKRSGLFVYDDTLDHRIQETNELHLALVDSVKRGMQGFSVVYQPIMHMGSGKWHGVEALCRWTSPRGPVSPGVFIPEAEKVGLIMPIGLWVLETAVRTVKEMELDKLEDFYLSVNVSPRQMMYASFADSVTGILKKHDYPGEKLNIEITESTKMDFTTFTISVIETLREQGVTLALDDFGTGYSSFNNLKNLPVHYLKTEREFIQGIEQDSYMQYFIFVLSEIAHANNMKLIAEGVENAEQLKVARNNGADYIQGFFFSKPLSAEELARQKDSFRVQDSSHIPQSANTINIKRWLSGKSAYEFTPALFKLVHRCMEIVVSELSFAASFQAILELTGRHFGATRAFVFLRKPDGRYRDAFEWRAEGARSHMAVFQDVDLSSRLPTLIEVFTDEGMVIASDVSRLPGDLRAALEPLGIRSIALVPLWEDDELVGLVGFDSDVMVEWSPDAIVMLWSLEMVFVSLIDREKLKSDVSEKRALLNAFFTNPNLYSYISDPDTYDIIWVDERVLDRLNLDKDIVGRKCYKVIANHDAPCPRCRLPQLRALPPCTQVERTLRNNYLGKLFACYDGLYPWQDGRLVHICYALDVSGDDMAAIAHTTSAEAQL